MKKLEKENIKYKIYILSIITVFFLLFAIKCFWWWQIKDAFVKSYNTLGRTLSNTPEKFKDDWLLLQISKKIKSKEFETAKNFLTWDNSESYFNNWTIKLLEAYNLAKNNNLEILQKARILIAQSNQDLEIAEKIQLDKKLTKYIVQNKNTAEGLSTIIETKTCYREGWKIIKEIQNTISLAEQITKEQTIQLESLKKLNLNLSGCIDNLINVISNNQTQLNALKTDLSNKEKEYKRLMIQKISNPEKCKWSSFEDTLKNTEDAQKSMEAYKKQQEEITNILLNPTYDSMNNLCNWSKNDNQINENLWNSISQMMKNLQKQSEKEQQKDQENDKNQKKQDESWNNKQQKEKKSPKESKDWEEKQDKWTGEQEQKWNWETKYKDVLNDQERSLLNQTQTNSSNLIKQIQQIKWQWNYNWYQYIKNLFNSFMWNEWDLKNLHEKSSENSWESNGQTQRY